MKFGWAKTTETAAVVFFNRPTLRAIVEIVTKLSLFLHIGIYSQLLCMQSSLNRKGKCTAMSECKFQIH